MSLEALCFFPGKEFPPSIYKIGRGKIIQFTQAIQDFNPIWGNIAPPTFPISLPNEEVAKEIFREDIPERGVLNGGNELEINRLIEAGERIEVNARLKDIRRIREMLFLFFEFFYFDRFGELVAKGKNTIIRYKPGQVFSEQKPPKPISPQSTIKEIPPRWDEIQIGTPLPPLIKCPDLGQLILWAKACGDPYPAHYDREFARSLGLPDVIVHGSLIFAFLGQMITDWLGLEGRLIRLSVSYKEIHFVGQKIICQGIVANKFKEGGQNLVELMVWTGNGEKKASGRALISLKD